MAGINKVILVGNVGRDPEVRYTQGGQPVASFSLATSERFKDREGNQKDRTEWHRLVAWGRLAEICGQYVKKGSQIYVEGRIQSRDWEDKEGHKRTTVEVIVNQMQMLGRRGDSSGGGSGSGGESYDEGGARSGSGQDDPMSQTGGTPGGGSADDEIPF